MDIEIEEHGGKFEFKDKTVRNSKNYCDDCGTSIGGGQVFQAIVLDKRTKNDNPLICQLKYENSNGDFLGLDKELVFVEEETSEISFSIDITVPKDTKTVKVSFKERKLPKVDDYSDLLIGGVIIAICAVILVFAAKGFFGWE